MSPVSSYSDGIGVVFSSDFNKTIVSEVICGYGGEEGGVKKGDELIYVKSSDKILHIPMNYKNTIKEFLSGPFNTYVYMAVKRKNKIKILKIRRNFLESEKLFKNTSFLKRGGIYGVLSKKGIKIIHLTNQIKDINLKINDIVKFVKINKELISFGLLKNIKLSGLSKLIIIRDKKILSVKVKF